MVEYKSLEKEKYMFKKLLVFLVVLASVFALSACQEERTFAADGASSKPKCDK